MTTEWTRGKTDMDMLWLWGKFQWILPLYMKPISFQSKASVVYSVTTAVFSDFCMKKLNVFSQHTGKKINEYLNSTEQITRNWNANLVSVLITSWYITQQCSINLLWKESMDEWAHRPYQLLSAPYHCCLNKHRRQDERLSLQNSWLVSICT